MPRKSKKVNKKKQTQTQRRRRGGEPLQQTTQTQEQITSQLDKIRQNIL
jgi:hypothetical protein